MQKILKAFFLCMIISFFIGQVSAQAALPLRIIVLGDGLLSGGDLRPSESFAAILGAKLKNAGFEAEVIDMSVPDATTATTLEHFDQATGKAPDLVVLAIGENDVQRGIPANLTRDNLYNMVHTLRTNGIYVVVMGVKPPASLGTEYAHYTADTFEEIAKKVPLYPYILDKIAGNQQMTASDGYRPNARGMDFIVNAVFPMIDTGLRWKIKIRAEQQKSQPILPAAESLAPPPI